MQITDNTIIIGSDSQQSSHIESKEELDTLSPEQYAQLSKEEKRNYLTDHGFSNEKFTEMCEPNIDTYPTLKLKPNKIGGSMRPPPGDIKLEKLEGACSECYTIDSEIKDHWMNINSMPPELFQPIMKIWRDDQWDHLIDPPEWVTGLMYSLCFLPGTSNSKKAIMLRVACTNLDIARLRSFAQTKNGR
ncbi:uncharacterized protein LOC135923962 isoform X1 [Gordionus sp. m RMFG-2023]|uniref:uncharacterized protein LOC135923962 isoform X1 n=1 Tax=Gordionus sp. m RMFG-2023 TaxID=3053472 RepID=UPI0031FC5CC3